MVVDPLRVDPRSINGDFLDISFDSSYIGVPGSGRFVRPKRLTYILYWSSVWSAYISIYCPEGIFKS
jgi:hypothetical protein